MTNANKTYLAKFTNLVVASPYQLARSIEGQTQHLAPHLAASSSRVDTRGYIQNLHHPSPVAYLVTAAKEIWH